MTRRLLVYGIRGNSRYTLLRGNVGGWFRNERIPVTSSRVRKGYTVRTEHVGDVIARAELDGIQVRMMGDVE